MMKFDFGLSAARSEIESQQKQTQKPAQKTVNQFDSAASDGAQAVLSLDDKAFNSEIMSLRVGALFSVWQLTEDILSDDLDDDELPSDRLDAYLHPDDTQGGDDEENAQLDEQIVQIKAANMADALSSLGVDDDTIAKAFGDDIDEADAAIESMAETIEVNTPKGDDLDAFITAFLYGDDGSDMTDGEIDQYDSAVLGKNKTRKTKSGQTLVYKGVKAVRNGKITVVNKRIGNTFLKVKLSPKQKAALRKASAKAITPNAIKKRMKSLKLGMHNGLYKKNNGL